MHSLTKTLGNNVLNLPETAFVLVLTSLITGNTEYCSRDVKRCEWWSHKKILLTNPTAMQPSSHVMKVYNGQTKQYETEKSFSLIDKSHVCLVLDA